MMNYLTAFSVVIPIIAVLIDSKFLFVFGISFLVGHIGMRIILSLKN